MKRRIAVALLLALTLTLLAAPLAWARLGGGEGFGGGSSGGGGGSSDGDWVEIVYLLVRLLIWLCVEYPVVGYPVTAAVIVGGIIVAVKYKSQPRPGMQGPRPEFKKLPRQALAELRRDDPNFSEMLFLDFVQMIYARYHQARGVDGDPANLTPYLSPPAMERLQQWRRTDMRVHDAIVGSLTLGDVLQQASGWELVVNLETNYTLTPVADEKKSKAFYTRTQMRFRRQKGVVSKGPEFTRALSCPSCGSPVKVDASGACAYCGTVVKPGEFAWQLTVINELTVEDRRRQPLSLGGVEAGTNFPTVYSPTLDADRKAFALAYPEFKWEEFRARIGTTFMHLQKAWSAKEWERLRPYETDRLFQTHLFWLQRYRDHGYTNVLENINLQKIEVVKVERDPFFDIITVRLYASMIDYTVDREGKIVEGGKNRTRKFSEYWTFIRKAGFKKKEPQGEWDEPGDRCPSCGAPLKVSMHGVCEYCGSNITGGDFDWTLAKIEQDEVFKG
ncbi:MAG TPA: TIM44-like domain-containing protein [bacterium]|nr:TIM44-like domain-containing protein [bacterium]